MTMDKLILRLLPLFLWLFARHAWSQNIAVIGHAALPKIDAVTVQKVYTGKIVEISGQPITVINLVPGHALRNRFLATFLDQDEEKYAAYWTVRRFIGKGTPPKELASSAEMVEFVQSHSGAIGYIDAAELPQGVNLLNKK
jgi:hypothetical protein